MRRSLGTWPVFSWMRIIDMNRMGVVSFGGLAGEVDDGVARHLPAF